MGKKTYIILAIVFTIVTFIGVVSVVYTRKINAGAAIVPALITIIFIRLFQKSNK
ncbi:MAG: hypothetical protein ACOYI2_10310 [Bacillota bacterium]|jgi:hypothetical protein|nr:hypothetical protein [Clostridia bacterium]